MELLLTMTGIDMGNLRMELEKLITYTGDRNVVTRADIQEVCTTQTQNKIFDMVRAVTEKNQKRALDLYYDLLTLKRAAYANPVSSGKAVSAAFAGERIYRGRRGTAGDGVQAWSAFFL